RWDPRACVGVVVASGHYPDDVAMKLGHRIEGLVEMPRGALIFHAGTRFEPGLGLVTDGGRVVTSVALGETVAQARDTALAGARSRGLKDVIAAAGGAAHLPGVVAAWTDPPVIGVPVPT